MYSCCSGRFARTTSISRRSPEAAGLSLQRRSPRHLRHLESADVARESSVSLGDDARFFQGYRYHAGRQRRPRRRAHRGGGGAGAQAVQCVGHYGAIQGVAHGGKRRVPFVALVPGHRAGHGHGVSGGTRGPGVRDGARARARGTSSPRQHPFLFRSSRCVAFRPSALLRAPRL